MTATVFGGLGRTFVGRAVTVAWDALPSALPGVIVLPSALFAGMLLETRLPLLGLPLMLPVAGAALAWTVRAAWQAAVGLAEVPHTDVAGRGPMLARGAALGLTVSGIAVALNAASVAAASGAPALITAPTWGVATGLSILFVLCGPRLLTEISGGAALSRAMPVAVGSLLTRPIRTLGCAAVVSTSILMTMLWGLVGLVAALTVAPTLLTLTLHSSLSERTSSR